MKGRLKYDDIRYVAVIYAIWKTMCDLSRKIAIIPEPNPTWTDNGIVDWDGMALIRFSFNKVENCSIELSDEDIATMMNMHLQYVLLPEIDILPPYHLNDGNYSGMESVYVYEVKSVNNLLFVDVLFVDSPRAYQEVRSNENRKLKYYI